MTDSTQFNRYLEGERPVDFETLSGLELDSAYRGSQDRLEEVPGEYPFTRGIHPEMYRKRLWTRRQQSGYGSPRDSNERLHYLLTIGQTGLNIDFDVATKLGLDPDHPLCEGDVGMQGTSIATLDDLDELMHGIPLDKVSSTLICQPPASSVIVAQYLLVAKRRGVPPEKLIGTIMNCALTQLVGPTYQANTHFFPIDFSVRVGLDVMEFCSRTMPKWNLININAYNIRETGVNAVQEAAFALQLASDYIERLTARGLAVDGFAPRIAFFTATQMDFFEEVAKLRAMRRVWAKMLKERFGAEDERSMRFRTAIQTAALPLTAQQPLNNIVRATLQTLAAVLGGSQSIHTTSWDEAFALPTEESHKLSIRTQQVIAYESNVVKTVDPLGGSYLVEALTDSLEERITDLMDWMRMKGGFIQLFKDGWIEQQIQEARHADAVRVENGKRPVLGVNAFRDEDEAPPRMKFFRIGREMIESRVAYLQGYKAAARPALRAALAQVREAAAGTTNVMAPVVRAVEAGGTLGEICDAFRAGIGYSLPH